MLIYIIFYHFFKKKNCLNSSSLLIEEPIDMIDDNQAHVIRKDQTVENRISKEQSDQLVTVLEDLFLFLLKFIFLFQNTNYLKVNDYN